jgi:hypothetical protein
VAEIRSTIDLIMERTRGMALSTAERRTVHKDELRKRARGFRLKLLENPSNSKEILDTLESEAPEDRKILEGLIWEVMVEQLPLGRDLLTHVDLMERLPQAERGKSVLREIRSLYKAELKDAAEERRTLMAREKKKLAALGISGSAVVPRLPSQDTAASHLAEELERLKKKLLIDP